MRRATSVIVSAALTSGLLLAAAPQYDWSNYDEAKTVVVSGKIWTAENIDGYVVVRINTNRAHPTDLWTVVLGTPQELKDLGVVLELKLGIPADAVVRLRKDGNPKHGRAEGLSLNGSARMKLRS